MDHSVILFLLCLNFCFVFRSDTCSFLCFTCNSSKVWTRFRPIALDYSKPWKRLFNKGSCLERHGTWIPPPVCLMLCIQCTTVEFRSTKKAEVKKNYFSGSNWIKVSIQTRESIYFVQIRFLVVSFSTIAKSFLFQKFHTSTSFRSKKIAKTDRTVQRDIMFTK